MEESSFSFKAAADERIEYGRTILLSAGHEQATSTVGVAYEVIVVERGSGTIQYEGTTRPLQVGDHITISGGTQYTLSNDAGLELSLVIFGVSKTA